MYKEKNEALKTKSVTCMYESTQITKKYMFVFLLVI